MRVEVRTLLGTGAGAGRDLNLRGASAHWFRIAQLAATYLALVAFVIPPHFTSMSGVAAKRPHTTSNRQRRKFVSAIEAKATLILAEERNTNDEEVTPVAVIANRNIDCIFDSRTSLLCQQLVSLGPVFRPLRC